MELIHCCLKSEYEQQIQTGYYGKDLVKKEGFIHFSTWNSFRYIASSFFQDEREYIFLVVDSDKCTHVLRFEPDERGHLYPHIYAPLRCEDIKECVPFLHDKKTWQQPKNRIHIMMNTSMIDEAWCRPVLKKYLHKDDVVCVLAFSFFDDTKNIDDWNRQYKPGQGIWYKSNTDVFFPYGLKREQIVWVNYFQDDKIDMENKIMNSSVVLLTGGAPNLMMKRIKEYKLTALLKYYQGVMMGYSAGAMVQLDQYHITPDDDYPSFVYEQGLGCVRGFAIEPHYHKTRVQLESIERVKTEKKKDVYALYENGGMIIDGERIELFGNVDVFEK